MIRHTEVDGVPALVASTTGPMRAGLTFRVGQADETLVSHGITHLVEHAALFRHGASALHFNGSTAATATHFIVEGGHDEIVKYFAGVCESLTDLPVERLETEKRLLRSEASSRPRGPLDQMALWRYGAHDYGLLSFPEIGLDRLTAADVSAWSAQWFTRDNAVFWIAGADIPIDLRLPLPGGHRMSLPHRSSVLPATPAYFPGPARAIGASLLVNRSPAATVFARLLQMRLFRRLRHDSGVSYVAATEYIQQSAHLAEILALVDVVPERTAEAVRAFVTVLADFASASVDVEDLTPIIATYAEQIRQPNSQATRLPTAAFDLLLGRAPVVVEELIEELDAVAPDAILEIAQRAYDSSLVMVPPRHQLEWAGFEPAPASSRFAVVGRSFPSRRDRTTRLVVGPDGVSIVTPTMKATVLYAECAAMQTYPDGGRRLIGLDAIEVSIEPALHHIDTTTMLQIDEAVGSAVTVAMPARAIDEIPAASWSDRRSAYLRRWREAKRRTQIRYRTRTFRPRIRWGAILIVTASVVTAVAVISSGDSGIAAPAVIIFAWIVRFSLTSRRKR